MTNVNWHDMFHGDNAEDDLLKRYSVTFDAATISLTMSAKVEYVGLSADGSLAEEYDLGTTYWIDFQSFDDGSDSISAPGSCGNRRAADYGGVSFDEWWSFTVNPADMDSGAIQQRMAYPPSDWNLSSSDCSTVKWERTFNLEELTKCSDGNGTALVTATETNNSITFAGTFFVMLLSPFSMSSNDYYRSTALVQHDFAIQLGRTSSALSSTGSLLFKVTASGMRTDDAGNYVLRVLTQTADFISLSNGAVLKNPMGSSGLSVAEDTTGCLVHSSTVCAQLFAVTIPSNIDCSTASSGDKIVDLSGNFQFTFTPKCRDVSGSVDPMCTAFVDGLPSSGVVTMDLDWSFIDQSCGVDLFSAQFTVDLEFYEDNQFSTDIGDGAYIAGQDTVYSEVDVGLFADDSTYSLLDVSIKNVFVCTAPDDVDLSSSFDANDGSGGCLSSDVDTNGLYTIIGSGADSQYNGDTNYSAPSANKARFSFSAFETGRTSINVHVDVMLTLQTADGRRRRMLLQNIGANQMRYSLRSVSVAQLVDEGLSVEGLSVEVQIGAAIGGAVVVAVAVFVVMLAAKRKRKSGKGTDNGAEAGAATHVPDLSPSEVVPETTGGVTITCHDERAQKQ